MSVTCVHEGDEWCDMVEWPALAGIFFVHFSLPFFSDPNMLLLTPMMGEKVG